MKRVMALVILGLSIGMPAQAEYTVKGSVECPDILNEDKHDQYREYNKWWLLGYFTARNYSDQKTVGQNIENDNIYQMALSYCQSNPNGDWDDAAIHVYDLLD